MKICKVLLIGWDSNKVIHKEKEKEKKWVNALVFYNFNNDPSNQQFKDYILIFNSLIIIIWLGLKNVS